MAAINDNKKTSLEEEKVSDKCIFETKKQKIFILNKENKNICKTKDLNSQENTNFFSYKKFCGKKRKIFINNNIKSKLFEIRKVIKNKNSIELLDNKDKPNINIPDKSKIKFINHFTIIKNSETNEKKDENKSDNLYYHNDTYPNIGEKYINNNNIINIASNFNNNSLININNFNNNINRFITIFNNIEPNFINEFEKYDYFSQSLNDCEKSGKYNNYLEDDFLPKCNSTFESHQKKNCDNKEFNIPKTNDFLKDNFIFKENNNYLFKENDEEFLITNKGFDLYNYKYFN